MYDRYRRARFARRNGRRKNDMAEFPFRGFPFSKVISRGRDRNAGNVERRENSALIEGRHEPNPMKRSVSAPSKHGNVASKIQYRVRKSGLTEFFRARIREKPLPYGSKIKMHPLLEENEVFLDFHPLKVRSKGFARTSMFEFSPFEIVDVSKTRNVKERVEISFRFPICPKTEGEECAESIGNLKRFGPIQDRKRGIGNESGEFRLEIGDVFSDFADERIQAGIVMAKNRDDEKGSERTESVVEFFPHPKRTFRYFTVFRNSLKAAVVRLAPEMVSICKSFTGLP